MSDEESNKPAGAAQSSEPPSTPLPPPQPTPGSALTPVVAGDSAGIRNVTKVLMVVATLFVIFGILGVVFGPYLLNARLSASDLELVAAVDREDHSLAGRVLYKGAPLVSAQIWAIMADAKGNRSSPNAVTTNSLGEFVMKPIPTAIGNSSVAVVIVKARRPPGAGWFGWLSDAEVTGEEVLTLDRGSFRAAQPNSKPVLVLFLLFFVGVLPVLHCVRAARSGVRISVAGRSKSGKRTGVRSYRGSRCWPVSDHAARHRGEESPGTLHTLNGPDVGLFRLNRTTPDLFEKVFFGIDFDVVTNLGYAVAA